MQARVIAVLLCAVCCAATSADTNTPFPAGERVIVATSSQRLVGTLQDSPTPGWLRLEWDTGGVALIRLDAVETVAKASQEAAPAGAPRWKLRSKHFLYGMPVATDDRYNFTLDGHAEDQPGISVLIREGFAIGHCDRFKVPLWVSVRWTEDDYERSANEPTYDRPFKKDRELPRCVAEHLAGDIGDDYVAGGEPPGPRSWWPTCRWITRS